jgi:hypothetical protein
MEIGTGPSLDIFAILNQAVGSLEEGNEEDIRSSRISVKANKKALEEKRQERLDKILQNLGQLGKGKCLGFLKMIVKAFAVISAPFTGGTTLPLALGLGGVLLNGLDRLQQAKNQKNYLLSKADEEILKQVIEEVEQLFDEEIKGVELGEEQQQRELTQMKQAIEEAAQSYQASVNI